MWTNWTRATGAKVKKPGYSFAGRRATKPRASLMFNFQAT